MYWYYKQWYIYFCVLSNFSIKSLSDYNVVEKIVDTILNNYIVI